MIIRPIHDISGNRLLSYDSSIYQQLLLGMGKIYLSTSTYLRDIVRTISNTLLNIYVICPR